MNKKEKKDLEVLGIDSKIHRIWYAFCDHMKKWYYTIEDEWGISKDNQIVKTGKKFKQFDSSKMVGYEAMQRVESYAKKHSEIKVIGVDDSYFAGSDIILVPHPEMGITVLFIPQCTQNQTEFFLYPHSVKELLEEISSMQNNLGTTKYE